MPQNIIDAVGVNILVGSKYIQVKEMMAFLSAHILFCFLHDSRCNRERGLCPRTSIVPADALLNRELNSNLTDIIANGKCGLPWIGSPQIDTRRPSDILL